MLKFVFIFSMLGWSVWTARFGSIKLSAAAAVELEENAAVFADNASFITVRNQLYFLISGRTVLCVKNIYIFYYYITALLLLEITIQ